MYGAGDDDRLFREAKGLLEGYAAEVGVQLSFARRENGPLHHPGRTVDVFAAGDRIGWLGEVHPNVLRRYGIDGRVVTFEIDLAAMLSRKSTHRKYVPIPQFPSVLRDLALMLDERTEYDDLRAAIASSSPLLKEVELFDVYRGKGVEVGKKSLAMHLTFSAPDRTLTTEEVDVEVVRITASVKEKFSATVRG